MKKTRTEYSFLNVLTGIGGYLINTIIGFICRMVFTRTLSADYLGVNGLFTNILSMLSLAELGIGSAIVYALYKPLAENNQKKIAALVHFYRKAYMIIGIVVAIVGLTMFPFLDFIIQDPPNINENLKIIYLLYLFNSVFSYFFSYRASLLQAAQKSYLVVGINYIITILQSILQIVVLFITSNYMIYLLIQIISGIMYNIIISTIAKKQYPFISKEKAALDKSEIMSITKNVKYLVINKLSNMLLSNTSSIITTYFSGLKTTGLLSNYGLFITTINSLLNQMFNGLTASIGNFAATENDDRKLLLFNTLNLANFWFFGWAAIGIFCCSSDLVRLFFGANYVLDTSIPLILSINFYVIGLMNAVWSFKNALGLFKYGRYILIGTSMLSLFLSISLGNLLGVFGIQAASVIARLLTNVWYEPYALFKFGLHRAPKIYLKKYISYTFIFGFTAIICFVICNYIEFSIVLDPFVKILICTIIPNMLFFFFFRKKEEFKVLLEKIVLIRHMVFKQ